MPQKTVAITFSAKGTDWYFLCIKVMFFHVMILFHFQLIEVIHVSFSLTIRERKLLHLPYTS